MADRYAQFAGSPPGRLLVRQLGLPRPQVLRRHAPGHPLLDGPALVGGGPLARTVADVLAGAGAELHRHDDDARRRYAAVVFDASALRASAQLRELRAFFGPLMARVRPSGRLLVLGTPPEDAADPHHAIAQRALEGFTRSAGKELRAGATAQLLHVAPGAEPGAEATLRFLLGARSAFVSGQVVRLRPAPGQPATADWARPLDGRVAVVTGASQGIGAAIAEVLARDGAHVVGVDLPAAGDRLTAVANAVGGSALQLDVTAADAPARLAAHLAERHGGADVVVHNAGITRDRTLARMTEDEWDGLLAVNLVAMERLTDGLAEAGTIREDGRIVCLSSMNGIAGQRGQANYATSKAGVIGLAQAYAPLLAARRTTVNAVAPGFIETRMTAAMPVATREAGRRMNSLAQGGLPVDVAETVAWLAAPGSGGVTGQVIRVDGQHLLGA